MADLIAVRPGHALFHVGNGIGIVVSGETLSASRPARVNAIIASGGWVRPTVFPENVHALAEVAESAAHRLSDEGKRGYRPPKAAKAAAQLALTAGGSPSASGVAIAQALVAGAGLSDIAIREIATYSEDDALELELRGGQAAREWAAGIADKLEVEDNVDDEFAGNYDGVETDWVDTNEPHEFVPAEDFSECFLCDKPKADPIHAVKAAIDMPYSDEHALRNAMAQYFSTFNKHERATIKANAIASAEELGLTSILPSVWVHTTVLAAVPLGDELPSIGDGSEQPADTTPIEATDLGPGMFFSKLVSEVDDDIEDDDSPIVVIGLFHKAEAADNWHEFDPEDNMWRPCSPPTPDDNMVQLDDDSASQVLDQTSSPEHDNYVELATDQRALYEAAAAGIDWDIVDDITMAVDPEYTPEERSKNATRQVRDSGGRFARAGNRVTKGDGSTGTIKSVNNDGTLEVEDAGGKTSKVKASEVAVSPVIARLPEALPLVDDPKAMIEAYEASVAEQRKAGGAPVTAAGEEPSTVVGPDNTDVKPLYIAVVDKNDPAAVLDLVALVPPGPNDKGGVLTAWSRKNKQWTPNPKIIEDLKGSTPPPIVQLDDKTHDFILQQVDEKSAERAADEKAMTSAGAKFPNGAMIALYPPENVIPHLTAIGGSDGTPPEDLHVTLVYFGDVDELARSVDLSYLSEMIQEFAQTRKMRMITGDISGIGRFSAADDAEGDPWYASVDSPLLPKFRNDLLDLLDSAGVPYKDNHGFTPHITLGYLPRSTSLPVERMDAIPVEFNSIALVLGNEVMTFELGCDDDEYKMLWGDEGDIYALSAAGGETAHPAATERLRQYWTHGEGAAKIRWGTDGDWTRCYRHLKKYMGVRAKGYCTLRHHDALGYWPGDRNKPGNPKSKNFTYEDATGIASKYFEALTAAASPQAAENVEGGVPFVIPVLVPEGVPTGDGREFAHGALSTRDLPLPLLWQQRTQDGHDESVIVGRIDSIDRLEAGGLGNARGVFDTGEYAQEAIRLIKNKMLRGVSADLDSFEAKSSGAEEGGEPTENGAETIAPQKMMITSARLMAATLVAKPAFQECRIELEESAPVADGEYSGSPAALDAAALVACATVLSSVPMNPPKEWFENPNLDKPTHLTVDDDGRVYGHIAAWHVDHVGLPFGTKPPRSASNYAYFRTGVVRTAEGQDIPVGQITLTGGHAPLSATASEAVKHYDDTASALCDVAAGEDKFGIWVAGALRPDVTPQQLRAFRAASPSGDWRPIKGKLELVAVCQVNVPGFPVVRARTASGAVQALVAAGAAELARLREDVDYSSGLLDRVKRLESAESQRLSAQAEALRARVAPVKAERDQALVASAEALKARMAPVKEKRNVELRAQHEALVARMGLLDRPQVEDLRVPGDWNEELHPRDENGKFREVLARLTDMLNPEDGVDDAVADVAKAADAEAVGDKVGAKALGNGAIARLNDAIANSDDAEHSDRLAKAVADIAGAVANATEEAPSDSEETSVVAEPLDKVASWVVKQLEDVSTQPAQAALAKLNGLLSGSGFRNPEDMARAIIEAMKYIATPNEMPR